MRTKRRPLGIYIGPLILGVGLLAAAGVYQVGALKDRIVMLADSLELSAAPVEVNLPPFVPLYVDGQKLGKVETVVIQREAPGAIDSVTVIASVGENTSVGRLEGCALAFEPGDFKSALTCAGDQGGLVGFGSLEFRDLNLSLPILLEEDQLPCGRELARERDCSEQIREIRQEIEREFRREFKREIRQAGREGRVIVRVRT